MDAPSSNAELFEILVADQVLSVQRAQALQQQAADSWVPLGQLLRQQGRVTMKQVLELLELQLREPRALIGELAIRAGYCTREQVEACLRLQSELSPHPLELLLADPACDQERLCRSLVRYVRLLDAARAWPELPR